MSDYTVTHLKQLESEAIFVLRETAAQFEASLSSFSGGKDSIVMTHLARKAFWPAKIPFRSCMSILATILTKRSSFGIDWLRNLERTW